ncbi:putative exported protein [Lysobacter dokdonensis DS-58]|uniref:Putative exported protein n=1 Tax=Lysobacter dokdonensis DS-58 TaxID=1300345 RepID=A0A0A2WDL6_9GAMM|nr:hypothetical protein [Lysobacter dokdonensis]KGQ18301.1 putative exported protein [Lysobacter dokdonensis DS-58]
MKHARLTLALALAVAALPSFAQHRHEEVDKVNGSITAQPGQVYEDLSTVNGSIKVESNAQADDVETVNGSIAGGDGIRVRSLSTVNGGIRVGEQAQIADTVETVNGSIFVDRGGNIGDGVSTVNGAIGLVDTDVGGGIETVNGDVTVGIGSHVRGGIRVEKPNNNGWFQGKQKPPRIVIGPNARVDGAMVFEREVVLYVHTSAKVGRISGATPIAFSTQTAPDNRRD